MNDTLDIVSRICNADHRDGLPDHLAKLGVHDLNTVYNNVADLLNS